MSEYTTWDDHLAETLRLQDQIFEFLDGCELTSTQRKEIEATRAECLKIKADLERRKSNER